ncbi:MAG: glycolate oxidase subunit GlcF [Gammaproteobacteria bacterium]|nr:glycolate oxidase subunit GlcF [Gammaproteobacteria bacterium]
MQVQLSPTLARDDEAKRAKDIIGKCVHCGFCNATCPTYRHFGDELQGPRGRIYLIKGLLERDEFNETASNSLSLCLTCRACETTCPSGVEYGDLVGYARTTLARQEGKTTLTERILLRVLPNFGLFRFLYRLGRMFKFFVPGSLRGSLYRRLPKLQSLPSEGGNVVLMQGCVQRSLTPEVVNHLAHLLTSLGIKFRVCSSEKCCGALHLHLGHREKAQAFMSANISALSLNEGDIVLSTASGCGSTLKEYGREMGSEEATLFSNSVLDVAEFLHQFQFKARYEKRKIVFQSPCTLQHGQKVTGVVEQILHRAGYNLCEVRDDNQCCGSAGSFAILQSETSNALRTKKLDALLEPDPEIIATANVGCQLHLECVSRTPVKHWIELLEVADKT